MIVSKVVRVHKFIYLTVQYMSTLNRGAITSVIIIETFNH